MESQGNPAVKWGLIFGGLLALVGLINLGIDFATGSLGGATTAASGRAALAHPGLALLQGCIGFLLVVTLMFLPGMFTARDTGRVGRAALAGLIAGLIYSIVDSVVAVLTVQRTLASTPGINPAQMQSAIVIGSIFAVILVFVFAGGFGAGIAALGGLAGRSQYDRAHPAPLMEGSLYTPTGPYSGAPSPGGAQTAYPPTYYPPQAPPQYPPQYPPQTPQQPPTQ